MNSTVFNEAIEDMASLGLRVSAHPEAGALPYAVIGGRSNARWWLIPLQNRHVAASGLALFQPLLRSARFMKAAVVLLSMLGLSRLWARQKVYISGEPDLGRWFPGAAKLSYAYFTGTDSPHRKVAVQIMDFHGKLLGFAKLSRNPAVAALLQHEAAMLRRVQALSLKSAHTPEVLFIGQSGDATLLVTDTLKTGCTRSITSFTAAHRAFLHELSMATADAAPRKVAELASEFAARIGCVSSRLNESWRHRLEAATARLAAYGDLELATGLIHGDFTPWNTFMAQDKLYVFDWEYAERSAPQTNDLIHYVLNQPQLSTRPARKQLRKLRCVLETAGINHSIDTTDSAVIVYLLGQVLRQLERFPIEIEAISEWDGMLLQRSLLELVVNGKI